MIHVYDTTDCRRVLCSDLYLKHEANNEDHGHTRYNVGMILDEKLVAQDRGVLRVLATTGCHFWSLLLTGDVDTVAAGFGKEVAL